MAYQYVARRRDKRPAIKPVSMAVETPSSPMSDEEALARSIQNASTRLSAVGVTPEAVKDKTPWLVKVLQAIDRPGAALRTGVAEGEKARGAVTENTDGVTRATSGPMNALDPLGVRKMAADLVSGRNVGQGIVDRAQGNARYALGFVEGVGKSLKDYDSSTSGRQLVDQMLPEQIASGGKVEKAAREVLGFGTEVLLDPLNAVTTGVGSLAKGFATKGAQTASREVAEGWAKAALRKAGGQAVESAAKRAVTGDAVEALAKSLAKSAAPKHAAMGADDLLNAMRQTARERLEKEAVERIAKERLAKTLTTYGVKDASKITKMDDAVKALADARQAAQKAATKPGLSIAGKELVSTEKLVATGGKARDFVSKIPVVGKATDSLTELTSKIFNPKYLAGVDTAGREIFSMLKRQAKNETSKRTIEVTNMFTRGIKRLDEAARAMPGGTFQTLDIDMVPKVLEGTLDINTLPADAQDVVREMQAALKQAGIAEQEAGILYSSLRENYMPHVLKAGGPVKQRRGGITGKLNVFNPSGQKRELGDSLEAAQQLLRYKQSPFSEQAALTDKLYKLFDTDAPLTRAKDAVQPLRASEMLAKANELGRQWGDLQVSRGVMNRVDADKAVFERMQAVEKLFDNLSGEAEGFISSGSAAVFSRLLQNARLVPAAEFIDNVKASLGTPVGTYRMAAEAADQGKRVVISKQSVKGAMLMRDVDDTLVDAAEAAGKAIEAAPEEIQPLYRKLINKDAPTLIELTPDEVALLEEYGGALLVNPKIIEAYAFEPGVVDAVNNAARKQIDAGMEAALKAIDKMYAYWKPLVTGLRPDYHIRNFLGGTINNFLDLGLRVLSPETTLRAAKAAARSSGEVFPGVTGREFMDKAVEKGVLSGTHAYEFGAPEAERMVQRLYDARTGAKRTARDIAGTVKDAPISAARKASNATETALRMQNYVGNVEQLMERGVSLDMAMDMAAENVRRYQFDYSDLSTAEKTAFRRLIPFYSWMRKNIPLQLEEFLNRPGRFTWYTHARNNFAPEADMSAMPAYMQNAMTIPIPGTGSTSGAVMLNAGVPMQDLLSLSPKGAIEAFVNGLSPALKMAIEAKTGKSLLTGADIIKPSMTDEQKWQAVAKYITSQLGVVGSAYKTYAGEAADGTRAIEQVVPSVLPGGSVLKRYNVAPAKQGEAYELNAALAAQIARTKAAGTPVPTIAELEKQAQQGGAYEYVPIRRRRR